MNKNPLQLYILSPNLKNMAKVLDKTSKTILLKLTIQEYENINNAGILDFDDIKNYEFVFDKPIKATDLLKTF